MRTPRSTHLMLTAAMCALLASATATDARAAQVGFQINIGRQPAPSREAYERGYREGLQLGENDSRRGRDFSFQRDGAYRSGDRGYNERFGTRDGYRVEFRRGFEAGYRDGFERSRVNRSDRRDDRSQRRTTRGYQEPATARGYGDGYEKGIDDGRDRDRYDPVRHSDYREGDQGYFREYGSKDVYKNNYRTGFRQGYEDGYRDGGRR